jgi:alpha-1,2-mannosyltransferase
LTVRGIGYALLCAGAVLAPLVLAPMGLPFVGATRPERVAFELFGLTGTVALLAIAALEIRAQADRSPRALVPIALFVLVGVQALAVVTETVDRSWDYDCYEQAARALLEGRNPYDNDPTRWIYQYPPLLAQAFAIAHAVVARFVSADRVWDALFYLYQCAQVLLVWAAFPLLVRIALDAGIERTSAAVLAAVLLVVDNPLLRTLRWSQINLWVLDATLLAIALRARAPIAAGLAVAFGAHLKIYPLALAGAWAIGRQWRALAAAIAGCIAIFLVQTRGGTDLATWRQFAEFAPRFPPGTFFRDASLHSVVHNTAAALERVLPWSSSRGLEWAVTAFGALALAAWIVWRLVRRERAPETPLRHLLQASDAIAATLVAAPSTWEHHYVLALPTAIAAVALRGRERPGWIAAALVAIFAVPTFDVFALSWHRLAGLGVLLWITAPDGDAAGTRA